MIKIAKKLLLFLIIPLKIHTKIVLQLLLIIHPYFTRSQMCLNSNISKIYHQILQLMINISYYMWISPIILRLYVFIEHVYIFCLLNIFLDFNQVFISQVFDKWCFGEYMYMILIIGSDHATHDDYVFLDWVIWSGHEKWVLVADGYDYCFWHALILLLLRVFS